MIDAWIGRLLTRVGAALLACAWAGGALAQSLEDELVLLETSNPQIRTQQSAVSAAAQGVGVAASGFLPRVSVAADFGYEEVDSPGRRQSPGTSFRREQERVSLTVTQNIFDGFRKQADTDIAKSAREAASDTLSTTSQNVLFEGTNAYVDILRQGLLVKLSQTNERIIQVQLELEDERVRRGSGIAVDSLLAKSRLQLAKERRVTFEGAFQNAIDRSGLLGIVMDINNMSERLTHGKYGLSALTKGGTSRRYQARNMIDAMLGPTFGTAKDVASALGTLTDDEDFSQRDLSLLRRLVPGNQIFWLRNAINKFEGATVDLLGLPGER